jgi:hypothetical protein
MFKIITQQILKLSIHRCEAKKKNSGAKSARIQKLCYSLPFTRYLRSNGECRI